MNTILSVLTALDAVQFDVKKGLDMLPMLGEGMLGIFIVIGVIILFTLLLNKFTSKKN